MGSEHHEEQQSSSWSVTSAGARRPWCGEGREQVQRPWGGRVRGARGTACLGVSAGPEREAQSCLHLQLSLESAGKPEDGSSREGADGRHVFHEDDAYWYFILFFKIY